MKKKSVNASNIPDLDDSPDSEIKARMELLIKGGDVQARKVERPKMG